VAKWLNALECNEYHKLLKYARHCGKIAGCISLGALWFCGLRAISRPRRKVKKFRHWKDFLVAAIAA